MLHVAYNISYFYWLVYNIAGISPARRFWQTILDVNLPIWQCCVWRVAMSTLQLLHWLYSDGAMKLLYTVTASTFHSPPCLSLSLWLFLFLSCHFFLSLTDKTLWSGILIDPNHSEKPGKIYYTGLKCYMLCCECVRACDVVVAGFSMWALDANCLKSTLYSIHAEEVCGLLSRLLFAQMRIRRLKFANSLKTFNMHRHKKTSK